MVDGGAGEGVDPVSPRPPPLRLRYHTHSSFSNFTEKNFMDNQHKLIKGYRDLSAEEIELVNDVKVLAMQAGDLIAKVESFAHPSTESGSVNIDWRWLSIGKTDLQKGFMSVIRSITRPETF